MGFALKHFLNNLNVALVSGASSYPTKPPFHPPDAYPEYAHAISEIDPASQVYAMARESLRLLGLIHSFRAPAGWRGTMELKSPATDGPDVQETSISMISQ